jgi:hypothetical protein
MIMSTTVMVVGTPEKDQGLSSYGMDYIKVSLIIFCSNDTSTEVVEGGYDAEDENTSIEEEDTLFQVSIGFDIIISSKLLTADIHLQDRSNDGLETIQVSARSLTFTI